MYVIRSSNSDFSNFSKSMTEKLSSYNRIAHIGNNRMYDKERMSLDFCENVDVHTALIYDTKDNNKIYFLCLITPMNPNITPVHANNMEISIMGESITMKSMNNTNTTLSRYEICLTIFIFVDTINIS
jgi:hypothetical protein